MKKLFLSAFIAILCFSWYYYFMNSSKEVINEEQKEVAINVEEDDATMKKSTHLKFKGVPIDGKLDEFKSRMKRKGFKHIGTQDNAEILQGDFADFKECMIYVSTLDNKDLVSKISVVFPEQKQWKYLCNSVHALCNTFIITISIMGITIQHIPVWLGKLL